MPRRERKILRRTATDEDTGVFLGPALSLEPRAVVQMMSDFLKTTEGRWNGWILVVLPLLVISAVWDFYRDGLSSLTGVQCLLMSAGLVAYALRPPRRTAGGAAFVAVAAILAYRIARDILHW